MSVFSLIYVKKRDFFLHTRLAEPWSWIFFETSVCFLTNVVTANMYPSIAYIIAHSLMIMTTGFSQNEHRNLAFR